MSRREAIARYRLRQIVDATPRAKRPALRAKLAKSMGFKGTARSRSNTISRILKGDRKMTSRRVDVIYSWYGRRARGEVAGVTIPKINASDYKVLGTMERMNITQYAVDYVTEEQFESARTIWNTPTPPPIVIDTVAHIRAFTFAAIERGGTFIQGASFTIPWGDMFIRAIGRDIQVLFKKFNGAIDEAFSMRPPGGGYRIIGIAFNEAGARSLAEMFDIEIDSYDYGVFLESRRTKRGVPYRLVEVEG